MAQLVFVHIGTPKCQGEYAEKMGSWRFTGEQMLHWEWLRQDVARACRLEPKGSSRGATRIREHIQSHCMPLAASGCGRHIQKFAKSCAFAVQAARAKIPSVAGTVDPAKYLKGGKLREFCHQEDWVLKVEPPGRPQACHLIDHQQEHLLRLRLLESGAAVLVRSSLVPRDDHGCLITSGFFGVTHSASFDRLILDRRPYNHGEKRIGWLRLPLGCMLGRAVLTRGTSIRGSGYDLSTYFTQLKEHESGILRNVVGREFPGDEYSAFGAHEHERYVIALSTIGMGDSNAVDIAECTHLEILDDAHALNHAGLLQWGDDFPRSRVLQGIYIDDGAVVGIVPTEQLREEGPDTELVRKSLGALEGAQVEIAWHKNFGGAKKSWR